MHRFLKSSALARRCPQRSPSSWQAERPSDQNTLASLCIGRFQHHFWTWWFLLSSPVPNNFLSIEMESFVHTSLHQRPAMKLNEIDRERIRNTKKLGKKRSIGKGGKWKKEGWSQLRQFWFAMIRRTLPVFSYLLFFFNLFPFSFFLLQSFFLILGSTNLRRSYLSFSTHRLYDLISCACAVACIVLGPCNQLNPICQATAISSMASQIQWQQQSLSSQVELWWIIHPPKVPGDGMGI